MLDVSATWQAASRAQFRYQSYLTVKLEVVPPGIRDNTSVASSQTFEQSTAETIIDSSAEKPTPYATLEPNRWTLDGTYRLLSDSVSLPTWWSQKAVSVIKPSITFTFAQPYTIPGMYIVWDSESNSWPTSFKVTGYNASGTAVKTVTISDVNSVEGFFEATAMDNVKKVTLQILTWNATNWKARVSEVTFGLFAEFASKNNGRISSAVVTDSVDPLARTLPVHTASIKLRNLDQYFDPTLNRGLSKYLAKQQLLKLQWHFVTSPGNIESSPEVLYLIDDFSIPADSKEVQINTTSRLANLTSEFIMGTYTGTSRTLETIAQYVLSNSGALLEEVGQTPWVVSEKLRDYTTTAPIPAMATNALLQLIAAASGTLLKTRATDGFIQFANPATEVSKYCAIDNAQALGDPELDIVDRLRSIRVGVYNYTASSTTTEVGSAEYWLAGTNTVTIKYSKEFATDVSATVTGATINSAQYYASYAVLTLTTNSSGATVAIKLQGKEIVKSVSYLATYNDTNVVNGVDVTVENPLVTTAIHAKYISEYVQAYYSKRVRSTAKYLGYPQLEAGDRISFANTYGTSVVDVTSNKIDFNGAWNGTVEVV
jgi:hypothetical protein